MIYTFIIKNEKIKNYRLVSQLLIIFNLLGFAFLIIKNEAGIAKNMVILFSMLVTAVYTFFTVLEWLSRKLIPDFWHRIVFGLCALTWMKEGLWLLTVLLLIFIILDMLAHRKMVVELTENTITIPYVLQKKVSWDEIENVVFRDGLLTIDFKNNRLFQQPVLYSDEDINEETFNNFCRQQLLNKKS
jgi:hypothetical protein